MLRVSEHTFRLYTNSENGTVLGLFRDGAKLIDACTVCGLDLVINRSRIYPIFDCIFQIYDTILLPLATGSFKRQTLLIITKRCRDDTNVL